MFPHGLRRDVAALLCVKILVLALLYQFFVVPRTGAEPDGNAMRAHVLDAKGAGA
jgi:hypothetical protein